MIEDFFGFSESDGEQDVLIQKLNIDILSGRHYTVFGREMVIVVYRLLLPSQKEKKRYQPGSLRR